MTALASRDAVASAPLAQAPVPPALVPAQPAPPDPAPHGAVAPIWPVVAWPQGMPSWNQAPPDSAAEVQLSRALRQAAVAILLCFGGLGSWLALARLDNAVVAPGLLEPAETTRLIQHLEGGIVRDILVRNGQQVQAGAVLLRLDPTRNQASLALFQAQILGARARQQRLEAEIALSAQLVFSPDLTAALAQDPALAPLAASEQRRFALLRGELDQARALLETTIAQAEEESRAQGLRRDIAGREAGLIAADLAAQRSLLARGLTSQSRVTQLAQRSLALEENGATASSEMARIAQSIIGLRLQIARLDQEYRARAAAEQDEASRELRALQRDAVLAGDQLQRVEIRAPVAGTVQESMLGTIGAVIRGGETIMRIVPNSAALLVIARVAPDDIDGLKPGAAVLIRFPAFTFQNLAPAQGRLLSLSRDRQSDPVSGHDYYEARVQLELASLPAGPRHSLVAGMAATAIIPTGERRALNYLLGPLLRRFETAMRED